LNCKEKNQKNLKMENKKPQERNSGRKKAVIAKQLGETNRSRPKRTETLQSEKARGKKKPRKKMKKEAGVSLMEKQG